METEIYRLKNGKFDRVLVSIKKDQVIYVIAKLKASREHIIKLFKILRDQGLIKSLARPKNKKIQKHLDELVAIKKIGRAHV